MMAMTDETLREYELSIPQTISNQWKSVPRSMLKIGVIASEDFDVLLNDE